MKISYSVARILGAIAESRALEMAVPMAIALVDEKCGLLFFGRMDDTLPASTEIAISKAYTAAALRMPTSEVGKLAQPGGMLYGIQHTLDGKIVLFGGGIPLRLDGKVAGGIGISGGTVEEDIQVAVPAAEALAEMERWSEHIRKLLPKELLEKIPSQRQETKLRQALGQLDSSLPEGASSILTGAILLALQAG